jgi:hypothetical protein
MVAAEIGVGAEAEHHDILVELIRGLPQRKVVSLLDRPDAIIRSGSRFKIVGVPTLGPDDKSMRHSDHCSHSSCEPGLSVLLVAECHSTHARRRYGSKKPGIKPTTQEETGILAANDRVGEYLPEGWEQHLRTLVLSKWLRCKARLVIPYRLGLDVLGHKNRAS